MAVALARTDEILIRTATRADVLREYYMHRGLTMQFKEMTESVISENYSQARERYAELGVDTERALEIMAATAISMHCWQGDDVQGFEVHEDAVDGGGIMATGNYPGPAGNADELRADALTAISLLPGKIRFNLHAVYGETGGRPVARDELTVKHFERWIEWAQKNDLALDFNPTFFAHPMASEGYTLSSNNEEIRRFWVRHAVACRRIAEEMGKAQGSACVINHWIPDGAKDHPMDRWGPRRRLLTSLDEIMAESIDTEFCKDAVECKLFGLGSEDYVVGSHEFYLAYVIAHEPMLCLDMGHFHPTEKIHDKLSAILMFQDEILLHVSRGVRWDSDHVVTFNDDVKNVFHQLVRGEALSRTNIALDFFDASINRIRAWVIGTRCAQKALLYALLEPSGVLLEMEMQGDLAGKLAFLEELKTAPFGAVWDRFCQTQNVPAGPAWISEMAKYDIDVIRKR